MKIYLAGSVPKGDAEAVGFDNWRVRYSKVLSSVFEGAEFVDPYVREADESDEKLVFGLDCEQIKSSDLIVVFAESQLGVGTSQEIVVAKYFGRPVITVLPKDTHHRRSNVVFHDVLIEDWIHPFLGSFSDFVVEKVEDIAGIAGLLDETEVKNMSVIDDAIDYASAKTKS